MWVVCRTAPPPLRLVTPPPPARMVAPPPHLTRVEEASSDDSPSDSSGYNDECPHVKEVNTYVWTVSRFQLFSTITKCVYIYFQIQNLEKKLVVADKELQRARKDNQTLDRYINAKRKKKETQKKEKKAQKKAEEEACKKTVD
jgi:hypothetical protein